MDNSSLNKEKIKFIINNLQTQFSENALPEKLLESAHLLIKELQQTAAPAKEKKNIAVVMPSAAFANIVAETAVKEETITVQLPANPRQDIIPEEKTEEAISETPANEENTEPTIISETATEQPVQVTEPEPASEKRADWNIFGTVAEAPTITYYKAESETKDLNEIFSTQSDDLIQSIQNTPIHDLTTAVGINDRYLFINELFRGDEFMYERSIITLNKFGSYEQAHAWAERELRLKLGWDLNNTITRQFEQLIKRRFAK